MSQIQTVLSRSVEESSKKFLDPDPQADDFQNLISSSLYTAIFLTNDKLLTNEQTNKQTTGIT